MDLGRIEICSARLVLRPYRPDDAAEVFAAITPTLARWMSWEPPASVDELRTALSAVGDRAPAGALVLRRADTGEFIGMSGMHELETDAPETGIWIKQAAHGQGFGREAVAAVIGFAAAALGVDALYYPVVEENLPSRRLAQSLGGEVVGSRTLRKPSGAQHPMVVYRIPAARPTV